MGNSQTLEDVYNSYQKACKGLLHVTLMVHWPGFGSELGAAIGKSCVEGQQKPSDSDTVGLNCRILSLQDLRRPIAKRSARAALGLTFSMFVLRGLCHFAYWLGNVLFVV